MRRLYVLTGWERPDPPLYDQRDLRRYGPMLSPCLLFHSGIIALPDARLYLRLVSHSCLVNPVLLWGP